MTLVRTAEGVQLVGDSGDSAAVATEFELGTSLSVRLLTTEIYL